MKVYLGADHRGFQLKEQIKSWLGKEGYDVEDCGNLTHDPADDYPDYACAVAEGVKKAPEDSRGIVICGSGIGVDIVANKYAGVRCGLGINTDHVKHGRSNDNINVLSLPSDLVSFEQAKEMVKVFLKTEFSKEERFLRRQKKIEEIEKSTVQ